MMVCPPLFLLALPAKELWVDLISVPLSRSEGDKEVEEDAENSGRR